MPFFGENPELNATGDFSGDLKRSFIETIGSAPLAIASYSALGIPSTSEGANITRAWPISC